MLINLSSKNIFIEYDNNFSGIFRINSTRLIDKFVLKLELLKFRNIDSNTLEWIKKSCEESPTKDDVINRLDHEKEAEIVLTYNDVEKYVYILINEIKSIKDDKIYMFSIYNKINVPMNKKQATRFYYDLKSFYENYFILEIIFKLIVNEDKIKNSTISDKEETVFIPNIDIVEEEQSLIATENLNKDNILDEILSLSPNTLFRVSLIHLISVYYFYITSEFCRLEEKEDTKHIIIPNIFPDGYLFSSDYFKTIINSLLLSLNQEQKQSIEHSIQKIILLINQYNDNIIYTMSLSYLFLIYCLIKINNASPEYIENNLESIIIDNKFQENLFNHYINNNPISSIKIKFEIIENSNIFDKIEDIEFETKIGLLKEKYGYILNIDKDEFIQRSLDFLDISSESNLDLKISNSKILDLNLISSSHELNSKLSKRIFNEELLNKNIDFNIDELLNYQKLENNKITSKTYEYFKKYQKDSSVLLIDPPKDIPKTVFKLFENLTNIINKNNLVENNISTLSYYITILNKLPNANSFSSNIIIFIIFQLIIPFYNQTYSYYQFQDQLLI